MRGADLSTFQSMLSLDNHNALAAWNFVSQQAAQI